MVTITKPQDTTFAFDVLGRYTCNTLDEALESTNANLADQADARPFDYIVIGGGSFGAVVAARLFNLDQNVAEVKKYYSGPVGLAADLQCIPVR